MRGAPDLADLHPRTAGRSSLVYDSAGRFLGVIPAAIARRPLSFEELPPLLREATVAIEDRRFYEHGGVDYTGILRAAVADLAAGGRPVEGGSTRTMQLVRNLYLSDDQSLARKIREAKLASELEDRHSKKWILMTYLNDVAYGTVQGQTAIGAAAAARMFFARPLGRLGLPELALLAGLPQSPSALNPFRHPKAARARRGAVLRAMRAEGMITAAELRRATAAPLGVRPGRYFTHRREPYFFNYVRRELLRHYDRDTVRRGGLRIETTLSPRRQQAARRGVARRLNRRGDPASAVVTLSARSGAILAMANSSDYERVRFNYATQAHRQPGSTFKTFVLATALRRRIDPRRTLYVSRPLDLRTRWGRFKVRTYSRTYLGRISIRRATLVSDNTVFAQLDLDMGPERVAHTARRMGISSKLQGVPAEGLGGLRQGVTPLEMARAYATLATGGIRVQPYAIRRVVRADGSVEHPQKRSRKRVLTPTAAWTATRILRDNVQEGTGRAAGYRCPAAGKTGTTNDFKDGWFVGFTPRIASAVWVGYPQPRPMRDVHGGPVTGGGLPAQIWRDAMAAGDAGACADFHRPPRLEKLRPYCGGHAVTPRIRCLTPAQRRALRRKRKKAKATARPRPRAQRAAPRPRRAPAPAPPAAPAPAGSPAPATRLQGPRGVVHQRSVRFVFSSPSPAARFECSGDYGRWVPCRSPLTLRVSYGRHVVRVRAVRQGRRDPTPASARFVVRPYDRPDTRITGGPHGRTTRSQVRFAFRSDQPDSHFECRLNRGRWLQCASPKAYPEVTLGPHIFEVRAISARHMRDRTPAETRFWVVG
jgi:penicillin-binding protein 1A